MDTLEKLIVDVFDPQADESVTVMIDVPHGEQSDSAAWRERRDWAETWRSAFQRLAADRGFTVNPILTFLATGSNSADLPSRGRLGESDVDLPRTLLASTLVLAMTEFSATAPLCLLAEAKNDFRAASMPGVNPRMEKTALAVDHARMARRCMLIAEAMRDAVLCDVIFSSGHRCWFDLRHRNPELDDGRLPRFKKQDRVINLPSGETYQAPYEGEIAGMPSWTAGSIPVEEDGERVVFDIAENRIRNVRGTGARARRYREFFEKDEARRNVAEVAFGVNDRAVVSGNVLEDEKAGFHWAFGRSDHVGGTVGADEFQGPETVMHEDVVYAKGNPLQVVHAELLQPDGRRVAVILGGQYQL